MVYRAGSFTEASLLLGISQPAVSAHIGALETEFDFPLFVRNRSGVAPTAKADILARKVAPHIDALEEVASQHFIPTTPQSEVQLGGPAEFTTSLVIPHLKTMSEAANVSIRLSFGLANDMLEDLRTGTLDVVLSSVRPRIKGIESEPFYDEEFALVASPSWKEKLRSEDDLGAIPVVAYAENLPIVRRYWRTVFERRPTELRLASVIPDLRGITAAVISGMGMSVLPHYLIADHLLSGQLALLHEPEMAPLNTIHIAVREGDTKRGAAVRGVVGQLRRIRTF